MVTVPTMLLLIGSGTDYNKPALQTIQASPNRYILKTKQHEVLHVLLHYLMLIPHEKIWVFYEVEIVISHI